MIEREFLLIMGALMGVRFTWSSNNKQRNNFKKSFDKNIESIF